MTLEMLNYSTMVVDAYVASIGGRLLCLVIFCNILVNDQYIIVVNYSFLNTKKKYCGIFIQYFSSWLYFVYYMSMLA